MQRLTRREYAALTPAQKHARRLDQHRAYNQSSLGKARYDRYEQAHPERRDARWEPARNGLAGWDAA